MSTRSTTHGEPSRAAVAKRPTQMLVYCTWIWGACLALPTVALAQDRLVCAELKAAVSDAQQGFAAHKGALAPPGKATQSFGKTYQAKKMMSGAKACSVVGVALDDPKKQIRQTAYQCQYPAVIQIDKALRSELTRCVAGEVDDAADRNAFTIGVDRVSSGEGYSATEVHAQVNAADGMTLQVRQTVCTNKGGGHACDD